MKNFLNIADEALSPLISEEEFEASLVHHLLFQKDILVEEGYIGDSSKIFSQFYLSRQQHRQSLFLHAVRSGIITPVLREASDNPIAGLFDRWQHYYGPNFPVLRPEFTVYRSELRAALQEALNSGHSPAFWPQEPRAAREELFLQELQSNLQDATIESSADAGFSQLWSETEDLRVSAIDTAAARTHAAGRLGISRTEIVNVVGERYGLPNTQDGSQIVALLSSPGPRSSVAAFLRWVTQCHHTAQARFFGTAIHFPVYQRHDSFMARRTLGRSQAAQDDRHFELKVELPPPLKLAAVSPDELLRVRSQCGKPFFEAMDEWAYAPSDSTLKSAKVALEDYGAQLCHFFPAASLYQIELTARKPARLSLDAVKEGAVLVNAHTGSDIPFALYIQPIASAWKLARWWVKRKRYQPTSQNIDVALPSPES